MIKYGNWEVISIGLAEDGEWRITARIKRSKFLMWLDEKRGFKPANVRIFVGMGMAWYEIDRDGRFFGTDSSIPNALVTQSVLSHVNHLRGKNIASNLFDRVRIVQASPEHREFSVDTEEKLTKDSFEDGLGFVRYPSLKGGGGTMI